MFSQTQLKSMEFNSMNFDAKQIRAAAEAELRTEAFNRAVVVEKERLLLRKPWWRKLLSIRITIHWSK